MAPVTYNTSATGWSSWTSTSGMTSDTSISTTGVQWYSSNTISTSTTASTDIYYTNSRQSWTTMAPAVHQSKPRYCVTSEANRRADKILVEHLSADQERCLAEHGYFDVRTMVNGVPRRFRIHNDKYMHNVFELGEDDVKIRELCAHTSHACPQGDHSLAQKLLLESSPEEFLRVANIWDLQGAERHLISKSGRSY